MAFQIFIPSFRAAMAQRAFGGSKARLELQDKVMTAKRLLFRKASDDEAYALFSLSPEEHEVPSMSTEIYHKLQD